MKDVLPNDEVFETWYEENYNTIRNAFEDYLVEECDYSRYVAEESDDGRCDFVLDYYKNI